MQRHVGGFIGWGGAVLAAGLLALTGVPAGATVSAAKHTLVIETTTVPHVGKVLATSGGFTLYRYTQDTKGKVTCTGACAKIWTPLILPKGDHVSGPSGVKGFSTIKVAGGRAQVSLNGVALYRYTGDKKKHEATGQGVEGTWFAVVPHVTATSHMATTTTTKPAGGGYGY